MYTNNFASTETAIRPPNILLVDDSPVNLGVVVESLEEHGYEVLVALDGEEALQRVDEVMPDLILLDVMMPGIDGFEVCRRLKAQAHTRDIPVIFMTSLSAVVDKVKGFEAGAVDYITKPLQIDEVRVRINTHLQLRALQRQVEEKNERLQHEIDEREQIETALRESEERYSQVFEHSSDNIYLLEVTEDGRFLHLDINPAYVAASGLPRELFVGRYVDEIPDEKIRATLIQKYQACLDAGSLIEYETEFDLPGGHKVYQSKLSPVRDHGGRIYRIVGIARDVSERKQHEALLEQQFELQQRLTRLADSTPGMMFTSHLRPDGVICMPYASHAIRDIFGLQPEEVRASLAPLQAAIHADDRARVAATIEKSACTLSLCNIEFRVVHPENGEIWVEGRSMPQAQPDGSIQWHGFMLDITRRKQAEALLQRREAEFRTLAENAPDPIFRYDRECRRIYANKAVERLTGVSLSTLLGKSPVERMPVPSTNAVASQQVIQRVLDTGTPGELELSFVAADGREITIHNLFVPEFAADGGVESVVAIGRDITAHKRIEEVLQRSEVEYRTLAVNLPVAVIRYDTQQRRRYVNPAAESMLHGTAASLLGQLPGEGGVPALPGMIALYRGKMDEALQTGTARELEFVMDALPLAQQEHYEVRFVPEFDADGKIGGVLAIWYDITERKRMESELRQQTNFQQTLLNALDEVGIRLIVVENGRVDYISNRKIGYEFGYSDAELDAGPMLLDIIHPDDRARVMDLYQRRLAGEAVSNSYELGLVTRDGERREYETAVAVVHSSNPVRIINVIRDISERKRMEEVLIKREAEFRTLAENVPDPIFRYDRNGKRIYVNQAGLRLSGKSLETLLSSRPQSVALLAATENEKLERSIKQVLETGQPTEAEVVFIAPNGREHVFYNRYAPEFGVAGEVTGVLSLSMDVTERKRMENALHDSEKMLKEAQRIAHVGSWDVDMVNDVLIWSDEIFRIWEIDKAHFKADFAAFLATVHPEDQERVIQAYNEAIVNHSLYEVEHRLLFSDGRVKHILEQGEPQYDAQGKPVRFIGTSLDITERKFAEQYEQFRSYILEFLSGDNSLPSILEEIVRGVEQLDPSMICSILLLDSQGKHLVNGIAPSLPDFYNAAIDGLAIGMGIGSCGTCAVTGERVIVEDIQTHSYWAPFKELAAQAGLGACWSQPISSSAGKVLGTFAIYHRTAHSPTALDISLIEKVAHMASIAIERKRMEEELKLKEFVLEHAHLGVYLIDEQARFTYVNEEACRELGYSREELLTMTTMDIDHGASVEMATDVHRKTINGDAFTFETEHVRRDGSHVPMEIWASTVQYQDKGLGIALALNISERKRAAAELAERERDFRNLAANLPDNIARWDVQGRYLYVNPTHERLLGVAASELIGKPLPDTHEHVKAAIAQVVATGQAVELVRQTVFVDGELQTHEVSIVPECDAAGRIVSVLGLGRNMTEYYRLRDAIAAREREFRTLVEQAPEPIIRYATDGRRIYVNAAVERISGIPASVLLEANAADGKLSHSGNGGQLVELVRRVGETGELAEIEVENISTVDGRRRWFNQRFSPEFGADGKVLSVLSICHDITERKLAETELTEARNFLNKIIDSIPDPIFVKDREHRWILSNEAFNNLLGQPREALIGKSDYDFLPKEQADVFWAKDELVFASGETNVNEEAITGGSGDTRYLHTKKTPFVSADGHALLVGVIRDITERKRMEEAVRESRESLSEAQRISHVGNWELDLASGALLWSDEVYRIFEIDPERFAASYEAFLNAIHPDDRDAVNKAYRASLESRAPYEIEHRLLFADGRIKYVHERCETHYAGDGQPVRSLGTVQDITGRKQAEVALLENLQRIAELNRYLEENTRVLEEQATEFEAQAVELEASQDQLKQTEAWYRSILHSAPDGMLVVDESGRIMQVNARLEAMFGYEAGELPGCHVEVLLPPDARESHVARRDGFAAEGADSRRMAGVANDLRACRKDGSEFPVDVSLSRLPEIDGKRSAICAAVRDISERQVLEAARENALSEALRLAQLRSAFLAQMSHELRTPLNGILGYAQNLLQDDAIGEKQVAGLNIIRQSGDHLLSLINGILDHASIEADKLELIIDNIPLEDFLGTIVGIIRVRAEQKSVAFSCEADEDLPAVVRGDAQRLRQVLLNLLANAVKFTDSGRVSLRVSLAAPTRLSFAIQDSGIGIGADQLESIFLPFEQAGEASRKAGGTGLGLAISRKLVRLMGGDITVESRIGAGSTFSFEIAIEAVQSGSEKVNAAALAEQAQSRQHLALPQTLCAPPQQELEILYALAQRGSMRDIMQYATRLGELDERYLSFAEQLRQLAKGYQTKVILSFVEQYLQDREDA